MTHDADLQAILAGDADRLGILSLVRALQLPDCWIGAGFLRNAVWDHLHGRPPSKPSTDIDVIWFDRCRLDPLEDRKHEQALAMADPSREWSVKNQARMHVRNNDTPYVSAIEAMRYWTDTATAVAVRLLDDDRLEFASPYGFDDLFNLLVKPTSRYCGEKKPVYVQRIHEKCWKENWPGLQIYE